VRWMVVCRCNVHYFCLCVQVLLDKPSRAAHWLARAVSAKMMAMVMMMVVVVVIQSRRTLTPVCLYIRGRAM
jgi:hypothetical protein